MEFIAAKSVPGKFTNFNFSVALTDEFMEKVLKNDPTPWMCNWKGKPMKPRRITRDNKGHVTSIEEVDISAPELMDEIVFRAHQSGEPGCVFIDTVNKENPLPGLGRIECCNPCGEQYLHSGDACNLGAINLEQFVTEDKQVDYDKLKRVTRIAIRMLDNVVDLTRFPVERVDTMFKNNRRIGLGIMGLADMLYKMKMSYSSEEGRNLAGSVMKTIQETAIAYSEELGAEKGNFPTFEKSVWAGKKQHMRNASLTNVAPTGSTAMIVDVSSGVEPYFALAYERLSCGAGAMEPFINKHLTKVLQEADWMNDRIKGQVIRQGTLQNIKGIPDEVKKVYVTSLDISAEDHILMQSTVQKYCCNAISKTVNFKREATEDDVRVGYVEGWKGGCKGLTVYRNGSRESQVLQTVSQGDDEIEQKTFTDTCKDGLCDI
jgi:ribonucleoside-diphosphate reductase alpha chain